MKQFQISECFFFFSEDGGQFREEVLGPSADCLAHLFLLFFCKLTGVLFLCCWSQGRANCDEDEKKKMRLYYQFLSQDWRRRRLCEVDARTQLMKESFLHSGRSGSPFPQRSAVSRQLAIGQSGKFTRQNVLKLFAFSARVSCKGKTKERQTVKFGQMFMFEHAEQVKVELGRSSVNSVLTGVVHAHTVVLCIKGL